MDKLSLEERKLNDQQRKAVEFGEGPLLIIAGAGTGKTTVVTERIKYLITSGKVHPTQLLALTFTDKACREMEERVDMALPYGVTQMWISTFHGFCDRILRSEAVNIGLDPGYKLMTEAETIQFFRRHLFSFHLSYFRPLGNPNKFIAGMIQHFGRLKDEDVNPQQYITWANNQSIEEMKKYKELAQAYEKYEELKVKEGVMDYSDLISNTLKIFRERKNILKKYQEQFKYILIDEFQDTNFAQNELAILLAGKRKNITVVGDDDQAIYRWRGAAVSNIIQFRKRFPKVQVVVLTKNYRSTQIILDRSYELIQNNNPDRLEAVEKIDKKLESMRRIKGKPIKLVYADRVENEAEEVAKLVYSAQLKIDSENKIQYQWKDFAILVRANNQAEPFVQALSRAGIPYQFLGPGQLFRQPEIKDLICYLKVLYRLDDAVALYRVLCMDWLAISPRDVAGLVTYAKRMGITLFEACEYAVRELSPEISDEGKKKLAEVVTLFTKHLAAMRTDTAGQILYDFLGASGLLKGLASIKSSREERVAANIAKFFNKLKTYESEHEDASVYTVVDWIDLSMQLGESPAATDSDWTNNNAVNILTVHSSKGLEFPVVFLVNLVGARFPTTERKEQIPIPDEFVKEILPTGDFHIEEERRLFYVGMTRARDELYLTAAKFYGEGKRERKISQFAVEAIGEERISSIEKSREAGSRSARQLSLIEWEKKPELEIQRAKQSISFVSYSQLDAFTTCPLQYKYRYIIRIPVPPVAALSFGDTIHKTLKAFYDIVRAGEKPTKEILLKLFDSLWSPLGYGTKEYAAKMKYHGEELLSDFYDKGYDPTVMPVSLEEAFKIKITPTLSLGGKIDRIDNLPGGKLEIIDYKTGQTPKSRDPKKDLQLSVYALAALNNAYGKHTSEDVLVSFYYLEGNEKISASRTAGQLEEAKAHVEKKAMEISTSDFRPTPGKHCDFCEFRLICEAWQ